VFAGRQLDPSRTVDDYNLLDGTQVHMLAAAGSGGAAGGSGSDEARAERQRREGVEDVNAQLRAEIEQLRAQNGELGAQAAAAAAAAEQERSEAEQSQQAMARRITDLERELGGGGGGGGMVRRVPREGVPPRRAVAAAQHPAGAVLKVENAGTAVCNGYYKENGALGLSLWGSVHAVLWAMGSLVLLCPSQGPSTVRRSTARYARSSSTSGLPRFAVSQPRNVS
jgi:hypothetical protein